MSNEQVQTQQKPARVRATVARGRTVIMPIPGKRRVVGHFPDGKPIEYAELQHFGPGQEIELPADEVKQLRSSGYLVDPNAAPIPLATDGPARAAA